MWAVGITLSRLHDPCSVTAHIRSSALIPLCPDLGMAKLVLGVVDVQRGQQLLCGLPAVHEGVVRDGAGVQDAVPGGAGKGLERRVLGREPTTEEAGPSEAGVEAPEGHPLNRLAGDSLVTPEDWAYSTLKAWVAFKCIQ